MVAVSDIGFLFFRFRDSNDSRGLTLCALSQQRGSFRWHSTENTPSTGLMGWFLESCDPSRQSADGLRGSSRGTPPLL